MTNFFNWQQPSAPIFDSEGRIQPLNCKRGELTNRIITVGDPNRAAGFKQFFDDPDSVIERRSNMIFVVYTGTVNGVPVSVVGTGMGFTMVEILLVQARAIVEGPIYIIRFGTCGSLSVDVPVGTFILTDRIYGIRQSYEALESGFPFELSKNPYPMDPALLNLIAGAFQKEAPNYRVARGPGFSADTFYASQGRLDVSFVDHNQTVIDEILARVPDVMNFEMETFILGFLAAKFPEAQIKAGAICIALAQRNVADAFLSVDKKHEMELIGAKALLNVMAETGK
jgi:uridine phosphorylase